MSDNYLLTLDVADKADGNTEMNIHVDHAFSSFSRYLYSPTFFIIYYHY